MQELIAMIKRTASEAKDSNSRHTREEKGTTNLRSRSASPSPTEKTVILSPQSMVTSSAARPPGVQNSLPPSPIAKESDDHIAAAAELAPPPEDANVISLLVSPPLSGSVQVPASRTSPTEAAASTEQSMDPQNNMDIAASSCPTPSKNATPIPTSNSSEMMNILFPKALSDWDADFEPLPPRRVQPAESVQVQTRGRKKANSAALCTKVSLAPIVSRDEGCDPISVGKLVWVLHDRFPLVVVAQGKAGVAWRTKSNKLGAQCSEGHQWSQVHRIFQHGVPLMFPEAEIGCSILDSALPPAQGRQKSIMWSSRHLVAFKP
ncbi:hypothetical protein KC19_VG252800 [Ceratodon purpureus]|uniref:Uncharacterized protein n=1 Tax=Ceratodon purpureus TaxID=3225 RepID=A0A8T0HU38_CERPU|nr:hypothetical protein KC19_VG252800 [Ceratodon purpureus]